MGQFGGKIDRNRGRATVAEVFEKFILDKKGEGLANKTLESYRLQFRSVGKYLDLDMPLGKLKASHVKAAIAEMVDTTLSRTTISTYVRTLRVFFHWCQREGLSDVEISAFKAEESVKETYSKDELIRLLKKPNLKRCLFAEYRAWVIVNLLVNNGLRAASIRNIQNRDVDFDLRAIRLRHTKNKRGQNAPLSEELARILKDYMKIRGGKPEDYLFPNVDGSQMSENALKWAIRRYNLNRGVQKTSIHMFRHTFARMYLVDMHGDALKLQRLLGHKTLTMTQHYVNLYDADLISDFQERSPLSMFQSSRIRMPDNKKRTK